MKEAVIGDKDTITRVKENIAHIPAEVEKLHLTRPEIMPVESAVLVYQYVESVLDGLENADNVESKVLGNVTAGIRHLMASKPKWEAIFFDDCYYSQCFGVRVGVESGRSRPFCKSNIIRHKKGLEKRTMKEAAIRAFMKEFKKTFIREFKKEFSREFQKEIVKEFREELKKELAMYERYFRSLLRQQNVLV